MTTLNNLIDQLIDRVMAGRDDLDDALAAMEDWMVDRIPALTADDRREFSATLNAKSTNDDRSLIDSILKLHATRLLHRFDIAQRPDPTLSDDESDYEQARAALVAALNDCEQNADEARIDVAIANAHHLLGNINGNRRWLDEALNRLPDLASVDLIAMANEIPPMSIPRLNWIKRIGLKLMGFPFTQLNERNRANLITLAEMQTSQLVVLAHLVGSSFEAIRERQRAQRAYRIAAHLIVRNEGLTGLDTEQLLAIAEDIQRSEREAAHLLAQQAAQLANAALTLPDDPEEEGDPADQLERAEAILNA